MADRAQLIERAKQISSDFNQITMPMMRKRLLEHNEVYKRGAVAVETSLSKKQIACALTYLSEMEILITSMSKMADSFSNEALLKNVKLMEQYVRETESLSIPQLLQKSPFAEVKHLLSLYQIPKKIAQVVDSFAEFAFGRRIIVLPDPNSSEIYIQKLNDMEVVGSISEISANIPEAYLFSPSTRLIQPIVKADYDEATNSFKVSWLAIYLFASWHNFQNVPMKVMQDMVEEAGASFIFFLESMVAAAENIGGKVKEVENALHNRQSYSFSCRTPTSLDAEPSRENDFRQILVEAAFEVYPENQASSKRVAKVAGKVVVPDREISISIHYNHKQVEKFVYSKEHQKFMLKR
ncbi:MAG: hypothetical protein QW275_00260 [Candidatus Anstonellaceae archaeon]